MMSIMSFNIGDLTLPEYDGFTRKPRAPDCKVVDTKRIIAEILGGADIAGNEARESYFSNNNLIAGDYAVVLKYRREKNEQTYPTVTLSYDVDQDGNIIIRQFQRAASKSVSFRFHSSFDSLGYIVELIRQNFTEKGIKVFMPISEGIEGAGFRSTAIKEMDELKIELSILNASIDKNEKEKTLELL